MKKHEPFGKQRLEEMSHMPGKWISVSHEHD